MLLVVTTLHVNGDLASSACHYSSLPGKAQIACNFNITTHVFYSAASWPTGVEAGRVAIQSVCRAAAGDHHALPPRAAAHVLPRARQAPQQPGTHPWHTQVWVGAHTAACPCVNLVGLTWADLLITAESVVCKACCANLGKVLLQRSRGWCDPPAAAC